VPDLVSHTLPPICRAVQAVLANGARRTVKGRPDHDPGVGEMAQWPTDLPDAVVGALPVLFNESHDRTLQRPRETTLLDADLPGLLQREHGLPENVALVLGEPQVSPTNRGRATIAGQGVD